MVSSPILHTPGPSSNISSPSYSPLADVSPATSPSSEAEGELDWLRSRAEHAEAQWILWAARSKRYQDSYRAMQSNERDVWTALGNAETEFRDRGRRLEALDDELARQRLLVEVSYERSEALEQRYHELRELYTSSQSTAQYLDRVGEVAALHQQLSAQRLDHVQEVSALQQQLYAALRRGDDAERQLAESTRVRLSDGDRVRDLEERLSRSQIAVQTYLARASSAEAKLESSYGDTAVVTALRAEIDGLERRVEGLLQVQGEMSDELCELRSRMPSVDEGGAPGLVEGLVEEEEDDSLYA